MPNLHLEVQYHPLSALRPLPNNPRTHSKRQIQQIARSIKEFGFTNPVLIDANNVVIAGNGRIEAAKQSGILSVPTLRLDHLSPAQRRAYIIADNRLAEKAGWDPEILKIEFQNLALEDIEFDLEITGFETAQIDVILDHTAHAAAEDSADSVPPVASDPIKLILPGVLGSDIPILDGVPFFRRLVEQREAYRKQRADGARKLHPAGYRLEDIWDGDGHNPNALLTVFRHFDTAVVMKGAAGDLPKTGFVLDYALFERLVYNLVVNYDVFGNVGHQALTRLYMDMIRMEAEELFLDFLPPSQRAGLRNSWYRGGPLTDLKLRYMFPLVDRSAPTGVSYRSEARAKTEFVERVINEHLPTPARGLPDAINWKALRLPSGGATPQLSAIEQALRQIASIRASSAKPFARFLPDLAIVLVRGEDGNARLYSVVHNREHDNISWMLGESERFAPQEDSLTVRASVIGAYPNMFFVVPENEIERFSKAVAGLKSSADYDRMVDDFGVRRSDEQFWSVYDAINSTYRANDPVRSGALDLTRYALVKK